jgi:hypothetical protein
MKNPDPTAWERGGCSQATGASFRSTRPAAPLLRTACTLHEDGGRAPPVFKGSSGSVRNVEGTLTSGGPNDAAAAGAIERASATTTRAIRIESKNTEKLATLPDRSTGHAARAAA